MWKKKKTKKRQKKKKKKKKKKILKIYPVYRVSLKVITVFSTGASKEFMMFVADGNQINTLNSSGKVILSSHFNSTVGSIAVDTNGTDALGHFRILYSLYDNDSVIYSQDVEKSKAIQRFIGKEVLSCVWILLNTYIWRPLYFGAIDNLGENSINIKISINVCSVAYV